MKKLVVATKNRGKLSEIKDLLAGLPIEVISMDQAGITQEIAETGKTFEENALIKAALVSSLTREMVLADDSGLEVDCLDGAPGIYSARFAGEGATDEENIRKLLGMMRDVPAEKRTARFVCVAAVMFPDGSSFTVRGTCEGIISREPAGCNGFGYDPVFFVPEYNMTMAQMDADLKNRISHRAKALEQVLAKLRTKSRA